ncbi:MAG: hypothetical protein SNI70_12095, partial [Rikenellaceae bacterium]
HSVSKDIINLNVMVTLSNRDRNELIELLQYVLVADSSNGGIKATNIKRRALVLSKKLKRKRQI